MVRERCTVTPPLRISDLESSGGDLNTKDGTESAPDARLMQTDHMYERGPVLDRFRDERCGLMSRARLAGEGLQNGVRPIVCKLAARPTLPNPHGA